LVVEGIETIDVTGLDSSFAGHSYIGSNDPVLSDLYWLLSDMVASNRFGLRKETVSRVSLAIRATLGLLEGHPRTTSSLQIENPEVTQAGSAAYTDRYQFPVRRKARIRVIGPFFKSRQRLS
jgi:hypothetical protein